MRNAVLFLFLITLFLTGSVFSQTPPPVPILTGPVDPITLLPSTLDGGVTAGQVYTTDPGMTNYMWVISPAGTITAPGDPTVSNSITVTWTNPTGQQTVSVSYTDPVLGPSTTTVLIINYYPFLPPIDPTTIPKYVDPLPHFAAGLRVNAKAGGNITVTTKPVKQVALSSGTVLPFDGSIIGDPNTPNAGLGNYAAYQITYNGITGPAMWPAQTIEAQQGKQLTVQYINGLAGVRYSDFNILADQTLMMNGYTLNGDPLIDPYNGPIPMVTHLHGGEMPSGSDGGPNAWFMPPGESGVNMFGPGFQYNASSLSTYPNQQEATTLWYHPHDDGLTSRNVYTGLAGYYFLRGADEEAAKLPGWSGDSKVMEVTPAGKSATFNGANTYLPEIEIAIQDRMFNTKGELYWPVDPVNPDIHPFWTPEFIGDVMTVNGKSWPYLSVAPRKYRFRMLEGCNARFLNMWLKNDGDGTPGPAITVIGGEGGLLETPVILDPALGGTLLMAPGQRYDVVIDFTGIPVGTTFTLMNNANSPYPFGDPVIPGITDQIMQFVVNGEMVSADNSQLPANLRPVTPLVKLTDFNGNLTAGVTPIVKRQLILNEVSAVGGPASALVNNAYFEAALAIPGTPKRFGGPTEIPLEGTTEIYQIINVTADAHPIHIHLLQWQLVSRQAINMGDPITGVGGYLEAYQNAWVPQGLPEFPAGLGYPSGAGSPFPYEIPNADGAVGGNPAISPFLVGNPILPARPEEQGWKDNVIVMPGEVTTFITRVAPTDRPITATPAELMFPFDPSEGPGFVWHCHIVDHEDMSMMRPLPIAPSPLRFPQITNQPAPVMACDGDMVTFSVTATSMSATPPMTYQWEVSLDAGNTWTTLVNGGSYSGVDTKTLSISPAVLALNTNQYRVIVTNFDGSTTSNAALLTVNPVITAGVSIAASLNNVCAGTQVTFTATPVNGGTPVYQWYVNDAMAGSNLPTFTYIPVNGDQVKVVKSSSLICAAPVTSNVIPMVVKALPIPTFTAQPGAITACAGAKLIYTTEVGMTNYVWTYTGVLNTDYVIIKGGTALTNTVTVQWLTAGVKTVGVNYRNLSACTAVAATISAPTVIMTKPAKPVIITASTPTVCPGGSNTYSVPLVAGVTSYTWKYSGTGATIVTPTANSTVVNFALNATSGTLSVTANNACGASPAQSLKVTVNKIPLQPGAFTIFNAAPCKTQSKVEYAVPKVSGVTYLWTYSGTGATIVSGNTTNDVRINFLNATSGTLSVKAVNACGTSLLSRDLVITVNQGCVLKSADLTMAELATSDVALTEENELKVFPNPTSGKVNFVFRINENARVTLDITTITGLHVDRIFDDDVTATDPQSVIFEKPIAPGVYFYNLRWNDQTITGKFIRTK